MEIGKLRIGLAGAIHPNMHGDDRGIYQSIIKSMKNLENKLDFELVPINEPLESEEAGRNAREYFDNEKVDFTMVITPSLGRGRVILPLARVNSFLGLWALPETELKGMLQLNSFCGLNMYSAIIASYLKEYDIPFKWFYGYPEEEMFLERFRITLKAIKAIKTLRQSRIGLIGDIADGFENFIFDERKLEKKFGTYIYTRHSVEDIVAKAEVYDTAAVGKYLEKINSEAVWRKDRVSTEHMEKFARVNMAFEDFIKENDYNGLAINCWPTFQQYYDLAVCSVLGRLNESGIAATCEGDIPGLLNMLMLNSLTGGKSTLMDLVALDESDDSACLWHCGPTPASWADEKGAKWDAHFNIGCSCNGKWCGKGVVTDLTFRPGAVTVTRINSDFDNLFVLNAEVMKGKERFEGSSGWINKLSIDDHELSIKEFINTLIVNRMDHHYPVAYGNVKDELFEMAAWLKINVMGVVPYKPYMQNPPSRMQTGK